MEEIKGERNEFQSDGAENHYKNGLDFGVFEIQIMRFLIKNVYGYMQKCISYSSGEHIFKQIMKKNSWKVKNDGWKVKNDAERA